MPIPAARLIIPRLRLLPGSLKRRCLARLRAALRPTAQAGIQLLSAHPAMHRALGRATTRVPGLRRVVRSVLRAAPAPAGVAPAAPLAAATVFMALPPAADGPISLEGLNFLSRSL